MIVALKIIYRKIKTTAFAVVFIKEVIYKRVSISFYIIYTAAKSVLLGKSKKFLNLFFYITEYEHSAVLYVEVHLAAERYVA